MSAEEHISPHYETLRTNPIYLSGIEKMTMRFLSGEGRDAAAGEARKEAMEDVRYARRVFSRLKELMPKPANTDGQSRDVPTNAGELEKILESDDSIRPTTPNEWMVMVLIIDSMYEFTGNALLRNEEGLTEQLADEVDGRRFVETVDVIVSHMRNLLRDRMRPEADGDDPKETTEDS